MRYGRLAGIPAYCGRFIDRHGGGLLLSRIACVLIFLFAATFESWIVMLWPRWVAASCTLPLNAGVPLICVWVKARGQSRSGRMRWYNALIRLVPSALIAAILIFQWIWLIGIRIPLNRVAAELGDRARLWQPTEAVFRGIDRYRRGHKGVFPSSLGALTARGYLPPEWPGYTFPSAHAARGAAATTACLGAPWGNLPNGMHLIYVGAGLSEKIGGWSQQPVILAWVGNGASELEAVLASGHRIWIGADSPALTAVKVWNEMRHAYRIPRIRLPHNGNEH